MSKTIREALVYVSNHPEPSGDPIDMPVWEHICRALYEVANNPNPRQRGSMVKATRAQGMILDRAVGRRRAGTKVAQRKSHQITFRDLTDGAIE